MKVSNDFLLREIAGEYMIVPVGAAASNFVGLISMNEVAKVIFEALSVERTAEELVDLILKEYDVDRETAHQDILEFLQKLRDIGALIE